MIKHAYFRNFAGRGLVWLALVLAASSPMAAQKWRGYAFAQPAQGAPQSSPGAPPQNQPAPSPGTEGGARGQPSQNPPPGTTGKITAQQAEELFRSVDDILSFASKSSHLPIKEQVKRALADREQVRAFVTRHLEEDQDAQRLQRSAASLKKFGLMPRDFDLRSFLVELLEDQVAGYYDPKTKTVYLLDWVAPEAQRPVLAHELTHALQDQNFGLESWLKVKSDSGSSPKPVSTAKAKPDLDETRYEPEEAQAAREAVSEGQAMAVLVDYVMEPSGRTLADAPKMADLFRENTVERTNDSPLFMRAPMYLRESLIFSYTYGLGFVQALLARGGKDLAFAGAFRNPPQDTREIMDPRAYLAAQHVPPLYLPGLASVLQGKYEKYDLGEVGQFDSYILLKQFRDGDLAESLAPDWRGGTYMLARRTGAPKTSDGDPDLRDFALIYLSRWATPEGANRFAAAYAAGLTRKYKSVHAADARSGSAIVLNNDKYLTEDGPVFIEPHGDQVLVMESFDEATATKLRNLVLARQPAAAWMIPRSSLSGRARQFVGGLLLAP